MTTENTAAPGPGSKQLEWLELVSGEAIGAWPEKTAAREANLAELRARVDGIKGRLGKSFDYRLLGKETSYFFGLFTTRADALSAKDAKQDALKELDVVHDDLSTVQGIADEDAFDVSLAYIELEELQLTLKEARGPDGEPLFDDVDIMRELYTPLVREAVMSENQVPDKYSEVANVFNQSAALYNKRLEDFSASRTWKDDVKDTLQLTIDLVGDVSAIAAPITDILGAKEAAKITQAVTIGLQAGLKVTQSALDAAVLDGIDTVATATGDIIALFVSKDVGKLVKTGVAAGTAGTQAIRALKEGDYAGALQAIGQGVVAATAAADPKGENGAQKIGKCVALGFKQGANVIKLKQAVEARDPAQVVAVLGDIAKSSVATYTKTLKVDKSEDDLSEEEKKKNAAIDGLTQKISASIDLGVASTKTAQAAVKQDADGVIEGLGEMSKASLDVADGHRRHTAGSDEDDESIALGQNLSDVGTHGAKALLHGAQGDSEKLVEDASNLANAAAKTVVDHVKARREAEEPEEDESEPGEEEEEEEEEEEPTLVSEEGLALLKQGLGFQPVDPEDLEAAEENVAALEKAGSRAEMDEATKEFRAMLEMSVGGRDPDVDPEAQRLMADQFDIDRLIRQMQMDQAILAAANSIFDSAAGVVALLVPQIAALKAGKEFLRNVVMAAQRAIELNQFVSSLNDANSAVSAYSDAISKRVADTVIQLEEHTIEAILQAAIAVGAALASTGVGPLAVSGVIVQKVSEASKGVKDLILRFATETQLSQAWKLYQQALQNPLDRKLKRMAMSTNPTLSKYAIAYGAYFQGDAIAKDIARKCGLNEEVLANPSTNVEKVVKYLEVRFNEDQILLRTVHTPRTWMQGKAVELSISRWLEIKALARSQARLAAGCGEAGIERYLVELEGADYRKVDHPSPDQIEVFVRVLGDLQAAVRAYAPVDDEKVEHEDMIGVRNELLALVVQEQRLVQTLA